MVIGGSLTIAVHIKNLFFSKPPITPQPFQVSAAKEYVTKEEVEKLTADINRRFDELKKERAANVENIHGHISSVNRDISKKIDEMDARYERRLELGNHTMVQHGEDIASLKTKTGLHS